MILSKAQDKYRLIPLIELAQHNTVDSAWLAIKRKNCSVWEVWDFTKFLSIHPGGASILVYAGRDASTVYNNHHGDFRVKHQPSVVKVGHLDPSTLTDAFRKTGSIPRAVKRRIGPTKFAMTEEVFDMQQVAGEPKRKADRIDDIGGDEEDGRLAKKVLISVPTFEVASDSKPAAAAKKAASGRPRGRPRKDATIKSSPVAESATVLSTSNTPTESQQILPKKRGRPPKVKDNASSRHSTALNPSPPEHRSPSEVSALLKTLASQYPLFFVQKHDGNTKEVGQSTLFPTQNTVKDLRPMNEFSGLFSGSKEAFGFGSNNITTPSPPTSMFQCPKLVQGIFVQHTDGRFTPAPSHPPPMPYLPSAGTVKGLFGSSLSANETSNKPACLFGSGTKASSSGGIFGDKPPSSVFGPPRSTNSEITFNSLFGGRVLVPKETPPNSVFKAGSERPRSESESLGRRGSTALKSEAWPSNTSTPTPTSSAGVFGSFKSEAWPSNTSTSMPTSSAGLFGGSSSGLFSGGCTATATGSGSLFAAMPGSGGNVGVGVGESGKVGAFGTAPSAGLFKFRPSSEATGGEANAAVTRGETVMQRLLRTGTGFDKVEEQPK